MLDEARAELESEGLPAGPVEVGSMVEVPAAALLAGALAAETDFLSIGTNDLVQYTMAAERGNAGVARLSDAAHPAVLRLIADVAEAAGPRGCRVGRVRRGRRRPGRSSRCCVGLGVQRAERGRRRASRPVKQRVRELSRERCRTLAQEALALHDAAAVRELVAATG